MADKAKIKLQYFRSKICTPVKHKLVVKGLGFTRLNQIVEREDTPSIRGMVQGDSAPGPHRRVVVSPRNASCQGKCESVSQRAAGVERGNNGNRISPISARRRRRTQTRSVWAAVWARAWARPPPAVTRARARARVRA